MTALGSTTTLTAGKSLNLTIPLGIGTAKLTISVGQLVDNSSGATGSGSLTLLHITGSVTPPFGAALASFDDREVKPVNIALHIGRRPILVFGNSDGDLAMMRYALSGEGASLALLLHHDDATREFEYDRDYVISPLSEALEKAGDYGITLVSMKGDWDRVFAG